MGDVCEISSRTKEAYEDRIHWHYKSSAKFLVKSTNSMLAKPFFLG